MMKTTNSVKQKTKKAIICYLLFAISYLLFGCDNLLTIPQEAAPLEQGYGKVTVSFTGGEARTVFPNTVFESCVYTFYNQSNGKSQTETPDPDGAFSLAPGSWSVEVAAYGDPNAEDDLAATGASAAFTVIAGQTTMVTVPLTGRPETGAGTFKYRIQYPEDTTVLDFTIVKLPDMVSVPFSVPGGGGAEISGAVNNVPAGFYLVTVRLLHPDGEKGAGKNQVVHIYNALTSEFGTGDAPVVFSDGDFALLPLPAPSAPTVTVAGAGQLNVSWMQITGATAYEVWYGASPDVGSAEKWGVDVSGSSATITGLTGPTYYVWVRAKNSKGQGEFSLAARGIFLKTIATKEDLAKIGRDPAWPLTANYALEADLVLDGWSPIGTLESPFSGVFEGNNHKITLNSFSAAALSGNAYLGIFAAIKGASYDARAEIANLTIVSAVNQSSTATSGQAVGLVVARAENTLIDNIAMEGSIIFNSSKTLYLGGVAGILYAGTLVKNCDSVMTMTIMPGNGAVPGIAVSGNPYSFIGGFVGFFRDGAGIEYCHNQASLVFDGASSANSQIISGGIAGGSWYNMSAAYHGYISDCSFSGDITTSAQHFWAWTGGIAGCIVGDGNGSFENTTRIIRCHASGTIGAIPSGPGGSADGMSGQWVYSGGIVAYVYYGALVEQCYFTGTVVTDGIKKTYDYAGGIAGYLSQTSGHNSTLRDCWSSGAVRGHLNAGGVVGQQQVNTYLYNCYSTAEITVSAEAGARSSAAGEGAGGIAGFCASTESAKRPYGLSSCVALNTSISAPNGYNHLGRVVGDTKSYGTGNPGNSYGWSGMPITVAGGVPWANNYDGADCAAKPGVELYRDTLGWDFDTTWEMGGDGYPHLRWEN
jgi:hypothetical protein